MAMLNLLYKEPDTDRWVPGDRYPRSLVRRILRGPRRPGGQERVFLNLCAGLKRLGVPFRTNDFTWAKRNPDAPVGIIGKPHVLDLMEWKNPILFGASVMAHPLADPDLLNRKPIRRILVPGEWMRQMCEPYWGDLVRAWPVGIDTEMWKPGSTGDKDVDVLIYDKIYWNRENLEPSLLTPIIEQLNNLGLRSEVIRYGFYKEDTYQRLLARSRAVCYLSRHETQGIAYQQALACDVPIIAWDVGGFWEDPEFFPHRVRFSPVSSVPYWDERCGERFVGPETFEAAFSKFWDGCRAGIYAPRDYILDNLTLEKAAQAYLNHWNSTF
ncbi:MAG: glycosyltransferase [Chthoniobacterales bacterium]